MKRLTENAAFFVLNPARTKVMPFPGKYPTRWAITLLMGKKPVYRYHGRPNTLLINLIYRLALRPHGWLLLAEYDRGGVFRLVGKYTPSKTFKVDCAEALCLFYYPWSPANGHFFHPWGVPLYHKQLTLGARSFYIYSPFPEMTDEKDDSMMDRLRRYRSWLRRTNPWK